MVQVVDRWMLAIGTGTASQVYSASNRVKVGDRQLKAQRQPDKYESIDE